MNLTLWEGRKLIHFPALWGFLFLCLAINMLIIINEPDTLRTEFNAVSSITEQYGQRVDEEFLENLLTAEEYHLYDVASGMRDIYEDYDTNFLAEYYASLVEDSPLSVQMLTWKYHLLSERVSALAASDAAMDFYAAGFTSASSQFLFSTLLPTIVMEAIVLAGLAVFRLLSYERQYHTMASVCSTRIGRALWTRKIAAGLVSALALYLLVAGVTLGIYFLRWDYRAGFGMPTYPASSML